MRTNSIALFNERFTFSDWDKLLRTLDWKKTGGTTKYQYTRPGKDKGVSGELIQTDSAILFHSYSSNSGLPSKSSGKNTYSPAEIVCHFEFNSNWKEAIKYFESVAIGNSSVCSATKFVSQPSPKRIDFSDVRHDFLHDGNKRLYRIAVNYRVIDKNIDPQTMLKHSHFEVLNSSFTNQTLSTEEIMHTVGSGYAICPSVLLETDGATRRKSDSWQMSELIVIDIDKGTTIEECLQNPIMQSLLFLYTTVNHADDAHRFRLVFALGYTETNPVRYKASIKAVSTRLNGDPAAISIVNSFYGNSNASIYHSQTNTWFDFRNGVCIGSKQSREIDSFNYQLRR